MNEPINLSALAGPVWRDFRQSWGKLVVFEAGLKLLEAWLFVPAVAGILSTVLARAGHVAVSNRDILDFLLTPAGLLYAALLSSLAVAFALLEQAGIMALAARQGPLGRQTVRTVVRTTLGAAKLGAFTAALLALTFAPFVLLAALTHVALLSQHDSQEATVSPRNDGGRN